MSSGEEASRIRGAVLLDTDVFSNLLRGGSRAAPWVPRVIGRQALVSFVTAGELQAWAETRKWGPARRTELSPALLDRYRAVRPPADRGVRARRSGRHRSGSRPR